MTQHFVGRIANRLPLTAFGRGIPSQKNGYHETQVFSFEYVGVYKLHVFLKYDQVLSVLQTDLLR